MVIVAHQFTLGCHQVAVGVAVAQVRLPVAGRKGAGVAQEEQEEHLPQDVVDEYPLRTEKIIIQ